MTAIRLSMVALSIQSKTALIIIALVAPVISAMLFGNWYDQAPGVEPGQTVKLRPPMPDKMGLWEAAAKSYAVVNYSDPSTVKSPIGGFLVRSTAPVPLVVSEYPMILSPNPLDFSMPPKIIVQNTTQDGALTPIVAPAFGNVTYAFGSAVTGTGLPPDANWGKGSIYSQFPPWWCTEEHQFIELDSKVYLGGQLVPDPLVNIIISTDPALDILDRNLSTHRQLKIWNYMNETPTLVVGKKPLYIEAEPNATKGVNITVAVTNVGFKETKRAILAETIPPGFGYVPGSFAPAPSKFVYLYDGSVRVEWEFYMPAAEHPVGDTKTNPPSRYTTRFFAYSLVIPSLPPSTRYFVPGSQVDTEADSRFDGHSADLLIETVQVYTNPPKIDFPGYPWWVFVVILCIAATASFFIIRKYRKELDQLRAEHGRVHSRDNRLPRK
jgi:hypothetical protein